jgi:hypothetical protein
MSHGEIILYNTEDGKTRVECRFVNETAWLSINQLAELFQRDKSVISKHLKNIFEEEELLAESTVAKFATVQMEGTRQVSRDIEYYNLDVILAVGYRVRSPRGIAFRRWATERLSEYLLKGFTMDDARLKQAGGGLYFDELLERIRDIRSSEKVFWRKVLDIYATSIDYDPKNDLSQEFFATIQNKMHWAIHGHTAAEVIHERVDATKENMGLTNWPGTRPVKADIRVAKNYLSQDELEGLNRIVTAYLEFAEFQALNRKAMTMRDWLAKLDDFLRISDREILTHAGKISHELAMQKAELEYNRYRETKALQVESTRVDKDFEEATKRLKKLPKPVDTPKKRGDKK